MKTALTLLSIGFLALLGIILFQWRGSVAVSPLLASPTDRLKANYASSCERLRKDLLAVLNSPDGEKMLQPFARAMTQAGGRNQCKTFEVETLPYPLGLTRRPNDMLAPFQTTLTLHVKIMPLGHYLCDIERMAFANDKFEWSMPAVDGIIEWVESRLKEDTQVKKLRPEPSRWEPVL